MFELMKPISAQFWLMSAQVHGFEPFVLCLLSAMTRPEMQ